MTSTKTVELDHLLGLAEIAAEFEVPYSTALSWSRQRTFPAPVKTFKMGPCWLFADIYDWRGGKVSWGVWLANQVGRKDVVGDLASQVLSAVDSKLHPRPKSPDELRQFVTSATRDTSGRVFEAIDLAESEWENTEGSK
jgi:hypothetical protein